MKLDFTLDGWQKEVLAYEGSFILLNGRQTGKTEIVSIKAGLRAAQRRTRFLIGSITEDQAELIIEKCLYFLEQNYPKLICKGKKKPTKHLITLTNGSTIRTRAVGSSGLGVRGFTVDVFVADEGAYIPDSVFVAASPMLLTTGGETWILTTPNAMQGYAFEAYTKPELGFKTFHVTSEEVANARPEPMRSIMLSHLAKERARMTELNYAQQYLAQFLEELSQFFPDSLIRDCQVLDRFSSPTFPSGLGNRYLGVDVARMGGDESTFEGLEDYKGTLYQIEHQTRKYSYITDTINLILELDARKDFNKIFIDDGGLGVAVFDQLLVTDQTKRKVEAINNARRSLDRDDSRKKKLFKEDLYMNLKRLMEQGKIKLYKDDDIFASLKSIIVEHTERSGEIQIYGRYSHIAEGLIRAAWGVRSAHLNIYFEVL